MSHRGKTFPGLAIKGCLLAFVAFSLMALPSTLAAADSSKNKDSKKQAIEPQLPPFPPMQVAKLETQSNPLEKKSAAESESDLKNYVVDPGKEPSESGMSKIAGNAVLGFLPEPSYCGNSVIEPPQEECDDGNVVSGDGCSPQCRLDPPSCGNRVVEAVNGEQCDDGNTVAGDGCSPTCEIEKCGDGVVQASRGEQCDDGNTTSGDGCSSMCRTESCGDGVRQASEGCDDGNTTSGDGCSGVCQREICGDNVIQSREQCDDGNVVSGDGCSSACVAESCGDGVVQEGLGEQCDDGNRDDGDGCNAQCAVETSECAQGLVCSADQTESCRLASGGQGVLECSTDACTNNGASGQCCTCVNSCGDGTKQSWEACDDSNTSNGDGCSSTCEIEASQCSLSCSDSDGSSGDRNVSCNFSGLGQGQSENWTASVTDTSTCSVMTQAGSSGNTFNTSIECNAGATGSCAYTVSSSCGTYTSTLNCSNPDLHPNCGNGTIDAGEECDDGDLNGEPSSTCSSLCQNKSTT